MSGPDPLQSVNTLVDLAMKVVSIIKPKFVRQPDPALHHLESVLDEISKVFQGMDTAISSYVSLSIDPSDKKEFQIAKAQLSRLAAGSARVEMANAKGNSGKIQNIYKRFLDPWFRRVLKSDQQIKISNLFNELNLLDTMMIRAVNKLGELIQNDAKETMKLVRQKKYKGANEFIENEGIKINPTWSAINDALVKLKDLRHEFIKISGAL